MNFCLPIAQKPAVRLCQLLFFLTLLITNQFAVAQQSRDKAVESKTSDSGASKTPGQSCDAAVCIVLRYEELLLEDATKLQNALNLRLSRHDVKIFLKKDSVEFNLHSSSNPKTSNWLWIVYLKNLSSELILLAVDSPASDGDDDIVREIKRDAEASATAWTMALAIEEIVLPYIDESRGGPVLGAGLAIIEPKMIGGTRKVDPPKKAQYPKLNLVALSLTAIWISASNDLIAGPRFSLQGSISKSLIALFSVAWAGQATYVANNINGRLSLIPIDILLGYELNPRKEINFSGLAGFSIGFNVYKNELPDGNQLKSKTDFLPEPALLMMFRFAFKIYQSWYAYMDTGVQIPFVRDVIKNEENTIFKQGWILPVFNIGFQIKLK